MKFLINIARKRNNEDINIGELKDILKIKQNVILLDVRSPQEFQEGHLNNAVNIPLYELEKCCKYKLENKEKIIIIYCQSGIRSKKAFKILKRNGFKNLYNLKGGLDEI